MDAAGHWWTWFLARWQMKETLPWWMILLCAATALLVCLVPQTWSAFRHVATVVHEMGHVLVGWLFGRKIAGVSFHSDTSGLTVSRGKQRGLGIFLTFLNGYPAPSLVGTAMIWSVQAGWSGAGLTLLVLLLIGAFWLVRNFFGLVVICPLLATVGYVWVRNDATASTTLLLALGIFLVVAGLRCVGDLTAVHRRRDPDAANSDAGQAAQHSLLPAIAWVGYFWIVTAVCAAVSASLLFGLVH